MFKLNSKFTPSGSQPSAISSLVNGIAQGERDQVLLGITGSGKTFTMASVIEKMQKPAIIMAHNKTLAAQLYSEMKEFFPENAVEYFISYYDYYQPEAYIPTTDAYIQKESIINDQINMMRHSATKSVLERRDVIVVTSVSAIYGLGTPDQYSGMKLDLKIGTHIAPETIAHSLVRMQYHRNDAAFVRGTFSIKGDTMYISPPSADDRMIRLEFFGDELDGISEVDSITNKLFGKFGEVSIYPNGHFVMPLEEIRQCVPKILEEMKERVEYFKSNNMMIEAQRIEQRTKYDMEMIMETGSCKGIENYSRYMTGRSVGSPPPTFFEYMPQDSLLFLDESHVTAPQIRGMYAGDRSRKETLVRFGFRLPSAFDNRPLTFDEWDSIRPQTIFVSATPGKIELEKTKGVVVEQIIRPTGLLDPECEIRPAISQTEDVLKEIKDCVAKNLRVLCITVTKKYSEKLSEYFTECGIKCLYIHSDIETLERISILKSLREGKVDVLIGINLLREGIDIPECGLVAILDADKEGFLRSESSLIQIIGRAARNSKGRVILYADKITDSIKKAVSETHRRRALQEEYNKVNNITPQTVIKAIGNHFDEYLKNKSSASKKDTTQILSSDAISAMSNDDIEKRIKKLEKDMNKFSKQADFENAIKCRDEMHLLQQALLFEKE